MYLHLYIWTSWFVSQADLSRFTEDAITDMVQHAKHAEYLRLLVI